MFVVRTRRQTDAIADTLRDRFTRTSRRYTTVEDDVAIPFLSYAAGLMTAAEIVKLTVTGAATTPNRVVFEPRNPNLIKAVAA